MGGRTAIPAIRRKRGAEKIFHKLDLPKLLCSLCRRGKPGKEHYCISMNCLCPECSVII